MHLRPVFSSGEDGSRPRHSDCGISPTVQHHAFRADAGMDPGTGHAVPGMAAQNLLLFYNLLLLLVMFLKHRILLVDTG